MRWIRFGLICFGVLMAAIAILVMLVFTTDLGRFKPQAESIVSSQLGRGVHIEGPLHVTVGREIRVIAEAIRIENPDWAVEDSLLRAKKLDVSLDTRALISGRILLENIELEGFAAHLEQNADGLNTWTLVDAEPEETVEDPDAVLDVLIQQARIRDLGVTYVGPSRDSPLRFHASAIDQVQLESGDLQLRMDGDINGTPVTIDGTAGSFANLLAAGPAHYDLRANIGEIDIRSAAEIDSLAEPRRPAAKLEVSGPNAQYLTDVLGIAPVTRGPLNLVATIEPVADQMQLNIQGQFGEFEIDVSGTFSDLQDIDDAVIDFSAWGPDAATFGELTGLQHIPPDPYAVRGSLRRDGDAVAVEQVAIEIGDTAFGFSATIADFSGIDGSVANLTFHGPDFGRFNKLLGLPGKLTGPFSLTAVLSQSPAGEELVDVTANTRDLRFNVKGVVTAVPDLVGTDLALHLEGDDLSTITDALDMPNGPQVPFDVSARISRTERGFGVDKAVARLGDDVVRLDGLVTDPPEFIGTNLKVSVNGASLREVADIAGVSGLPEAAFEISASVDRIAEGLAIRDGKARLADDRLRFEGLVGNQPLERDTDLRFELSGPDLTATASMAGIDPANLPPGSFQAAGHIERKASYFDIDDITARLGDTRVKLDGRLGDLTDLEGTDIDITIEGNSLAGLAPESGDFSLADVRFNVAGNVSIAGNALHVRRLQTRIGAGELTGEISAAMSPMFSEGSVEINASGPDVTEWLPSSSEFIPVGAPFELVSAVDWRDARVRVDQLSIKIAKAQLVVSGQLHMGTDFTQTNLSVDAQVASMSNLGRIAGRELPDEPLTLTASLVGSGKTLRLDNLRVNTGKSDLSGTAAYDDSGEVPRVDVGLTSSFLNIAPFLPEEEENAVASEAVPQPDDSRVIPDTPIAVEGLKQLNARVNVTVGELLLPDSRIKDLLLDGSLQGGELRIKKFGFTGQRGAVLGGQLEILPAAEGARISAAIDGSNLSLGFTPVRPDAVDELPIYDLQLRFEASGATARDMAASLDGTVRMVGGSGKVKSVPGWFLRDFAGEVFDAVNPFSKKEDYAQIQCFAVLLRSVDGRIDGEPALVLQTDKLNIISVAYVDLDTESIDVKFETNARKGIGIGAADFITPYTKISGTMANPRLAFDTEEAITRGATTAATLGTSWIAKKVKNRFFSEKDPCGKEVSKADEEMRQVRGE